MRSGLGSKIGLKEAVSTGVPVSFLRLSRQITRYYVTFELDRFLSRLVMIIHRHLTSCQFLRCPTAQLGTRPPRSLVFLDHTQLDIHTHTHTHTRYDSSKRVISPSQTPLPKQHTTNTRDEHPCSQRDSNPDSSTPAAADLCLKPHGHGNWP
jgi:hypothetical protein